MTTRRRLTVSQGAEVMAEVVTEQRGLIGKVEVRVSSSAGTAGEITQVRGRGGRGLGIKCVCVFCVCQCVSVRVLCRCARVSGCECQCAGEGASLCVCEEVRETDRSGGRLLPPFLFVGRGAVCDREAVQADERE